MKNLILISAMYYTHNGLKNKRQGQTEIKQRGRCNIMEPVQKLQFLNSNL
jgi:hypothetical protein